jgi:hypothetical protein
MIRIFQYKYGDNYGSFLLYRTYFTYEFDFNLKIK